VEFKATGSINKFKGFLAVYQESKPDENGSARQEGEEESVLPEMHEGEILNLKELLPDQHFTQPPPRYNEASLVKALESKGIGRPSTYATILSTIQDREYVEKHDGKFYPTETGEVVLELLISSFHELFDYEYTARMEDHLDRIESGRENWKEAMREFYGRFSRRLKVAEKEMRDIKTEAIETEDVCEKCGSKMVIKWGKFGRFLACSSYPKCRNTRELPKDSDFSEPEKSKSEEFECEKCGRPMVLKRGRFGEFMACSGYPECRNTKRIVKSAEDVTIKQDIPLEEQCPLCDKKLAIKHGPYGEFTACSDYPNCKYIKLKSTGVPCGKTGCTGTIVERKSRRGKTFYGCSNYPECDFVLWNKPLPDPCPLCGAPFTLIKITKRSGAIRFCNNEACKFRESADNQ
jgi:DNA topoisomerase-1